MHLAQIMQQVARAIDSQDSRLNDPCHAMVLDIIAAQLGGGICQ